MIICERRLKEVNFKDVEDLVKNQFPETFYLDYKQDYPDNKKLAKLMISFTNATGGYIIIGIKEKKGEDPLTGQEFNTGIPESIIGVNKEDHETKITQILLAHSQPKIVPEVISFENAKDPSKDIVITYAY